MIDGVHFGEHLCVVALGIGIDGTKHPLAVVDGSTENATVVTDLLVGLRDWGLDVTRPILVVVDGAKALVAAARAVFDHPSRSLPTPQSQKRQGETGQGLADSDSPNWLMLTASTPGAPELARTFSHARNNRRFSMSNDFRLFSFDPSVGSSPPDGLASGRSDPSGPFTPTPLQGLHCYYGPVCPCAPHRYSPPRDIPPLAFSLSRPGG